jgi:hypothetical protein
VNPSGLADIADFNFRVRSCYNGDPRGRNHKPGLLQCTTIEIELLPAWVLSYKMQPLCLHQSCDLSSMYEVRRELVIKVRSDRRYSQIACSGKSALSKQGLQWGRNIRRVLILDKDADSSQRCSAPFIVGMLDQDQAAGRCFDWCRKPSQAPNVGRGSCASFINARLLFNRQRLSVTWWALLETGERIGARSSSCMLLPGGLLQIASSAALFLGGHASSWGTLHAPVVAEGRCMRFSLNALGCFRLRRA